MGAFAEPLTPETFAALEERYGDQPEWMKISGYRESWDPTSHRKKSELMLALQGKDYWFPLSPKVYEKFIEKIVTESRYDGLRYLQRYIRNYREYKDRWPSEPYVRKNKLARDSFIPESATTSQVGIPQIIIDAIIDAVDNGWTVEKIARSFGLSGNQVESVVNLAFGFEKKSIKDDLIRAVADGSVSVEEAVVSLSRAAGDRTKSLRTLRVMGKGSETMKSIRSKGQKPRSQSMRITPSSV